MSHAIAAAGAGERRDRKLQHRHVITVTTPMTWGFEAGEAGRAVTYDVPGALCAL